MTTIVFKNGVMAADGLVSDDGNQIHMSNYEKIRSCGQYIVGLAGTCSDFDGVFKWFEDGCEEEECPEGDWEALVWDNEKQLLKCFEGNEKPVIYPIGNAAAIGSGGKYAMVAMRCGRTAKQAVTIAKDFDTATGGTIQLVTVDG